MHIYTHTRTHKYTGACSTIGSTTAPRQHAHSTCSSTTQRYPRAHNREHTTRATISWWLSPCWLYLGYVNMLVVVWVCVCDRE